LQKKCVKRKNTGRGTVMKKFFAVVLFSMLLLTGCLRDATGPSEITDAHAENGQIELPAAESEETEISDEEPKEQPEARPDVIFALRKSDEKDLPEDVVIGGELADAIAQAVLEQIGESELLVRVLYVGIPEYYSGSALHVEYEAYPKDCDRLSLQTRLTDGMQLEIARENGGYAPGVPRVQNEYTEERIETLKRICREENFPQTGMETSLFLDRESRICLIHNGEILVTDRRFTENVNELQDKVVWQGVGDTVVLLSHETRYYFDPFRIHVSRDSGKTWTETLPELAPLGKNGQHSELSFLNARIQIRENGQIFIFTATNLASLNIFTVPADSTEAILLFREQIGGYETTALVDAGMISDKRGYVTLMHPRYAGSNGIYRTTDGGTTWVRCIVPMPKECTDVWSMCLFMPQVQSEWLEWTMVGTWNTGSCTYASHDGGWTWEIVETTSTNG